MAMLWAFLCLAFLGSSYGCGNPAIKPALNFNQKIVNGENALSGSWPWQVSLQEKNGFHFCGGSLINKNWVITAAHCNVSPSRHLVVLGEYDQSSNAEPIQVRTISKIITHPGWNPNTMNNDITVLKLSSPVQFTSRISPVCLATDNNIPQDITCVTTGWGRTSGIVNTTPARLQQVVLPLVTVNQCKQYWGSRITNAMICAGGSGASSCQGDSGGPLVCRQNSLQEAPWVQVGIVSWGTSNCDVRAPAMYTRISTFSSWVYQTVANN